MSSSHWAETKIYSHGIFNMKGNLLISTDGVDVLLKQDSSRICVNYELEQKPIGRELTWCMFLTVPVTLTWVTLSIRWLRH